MIQANQTARQGTPVRLYLSKFHAEHARHLQEVQDLLACKRGCSACCHQPVLVTAPEVLDLAAHLRETLSLAELEALRERLAIAAGQRRKLSIQQWTDRGLPCPLLTNDGTCQGYEFRPIACRSEHSLDAAACQIKNGTHPIIGELALLGHVILGGLILDLVQSGLRGVHLDLAMALHQVLDEPEAEARWRRGDLRLDPAPKDP